MKAGTNSKLLTRIFVEYRCVMINRGRICSEKVGETRIDLDNRVGTQHKATTDSRTASRCIGVSETLMLETGVVFLHANPHRSEIRRNDYSTPSR